MVDNWPSIQDSQRKCRVWPVLLSYPRMGLKHERKKTIISFFITSLFKHHFRGIQTSSRGGTRVRGAGVHLKMIPRNWVLTPALSKHLKNSQHVHLMDGITNISIHQILFFPKSYLNLNCWNGPFVHATQKNLLGRPLHIGTSNTAFWSGFDCLKSCGWLVSRLLCYVHRIYNWSQIEG